jgi:hypothetical protein
MRGIIRFAFELEMPIGILAQLVMRMETKNMIIKGGENRKGYPSSIIAKKRRLRGYPSPFNN